MLEIHTIFLLENMKGRGHLEELCVDGKIILEWISETCGVRVWTGFIGLRIRTNGWLFNTVMNLRVP
jgi:hypothetical protein